MKGLVNSDPAKATELLRQAPQLSYAIFQSLLLLGLVDTSLLASVVEQAQNAPLAPPPVQQQPQQPPQPSYPPQMPTPYPPHQQYMPAPTPPVQQMHAPPMPQSNPAIPPHLLAQVMALTQQQIDSFPPAERSQIMMLREQLSSGRLRA
ncbi:hypothetical protein MRB53_037033 [Persea americana]|nr:hypothetical protein MRB53_037033 [Persea americana]